MKDCVSFHLKMLMLTPLLSLDLEVDLSMQLKYAALLKKADWSIAPRTRMLALALTPMMLESPATELVCYKKILTNF